MLENVRFYKEETKNDPGYAEKLAANADIYVNDAFGTAHRAHASTEGDNPRPTALSCLQLSRFTSLCQYIVSIQYGYIVAKYIYIYILGVQRS